MIIGEILNLFFKIFFIITLIPIQPIHSSSFDDNYSDSNDSDLLDLIIDECNSLTISPIVSEKSNKRVSFANLPIQKLANVKEPAIILIKKFINETSYDLLLRDEITNNRADVIPAGLNKEIRGNPYTIGSSRDISLAEAYEKGIRVGMNFSVDLYHAQSCQLIKKGIFLNIAVAERYHEQYGVLKDIHILFGEKDKVAFPLLFERCIPVQDNIYKDAESKESRVDITLKFTMEDEHLTFDIDKFVKKESCNSKKINKKQK